MIVVGERTKQNLKLLDFDIENRPLTYLRMAARRRQPKACATRHQMVVIATLIACRVRRNLRPRDHQPASQPSDELSEPKTWAASARADIQHTPNLHHAYGTV
jgi:hypothetical protein